MSAIDSSFVAKKICPGQRLVLVSGWRSVVKFTFMPLAHTNKTKCTVLVIQLFLTNYVQAHENCLEVLPHINAYLSTTRPRTIARSRKLPVFCKQCISKNSVFQDQDNFSRNRPKCIKPKFSRGYAPHPLLTGLPSLRGCLPHTKVGAKCLAAVMLDNQDRTGPCPSIFWSAQFAK